MGGEGRNGRGKGSLEGVPDSSLHRNYLSFCEPENPSCYFNPLSEEAVDQPCSPIRFRPFVAFLLKVQHQLASDESVWWSVGWKDTGHVSSLDLSGLCHVFCIHMRQGNDGAKHFQGCDCVCTSWRQICSQQILADPRMFPSLGSCKTRSGVDSNTIMCFCIQTLLTLSS